MERVANVSKVNKKPRRRRKVLKSTTIFIIVMLLYPVAHFILMWIGVNLNSILLSFQYYERFAYHWYTLPHLFDNFGKLIQSIKNESDVRQMFLFSMSFSLINVFIILPISLFFSYFIFKKILGSGFFKIIFFLPSILPLVVLTLVYKISLNQSGPLGSLLMNMGVNVPNLFVQSQSSVKWMVWIFCVWAGIGYDVILLTAGMARIPRDILESCKMDGVPPIKEFVRVVIPLTWPTISTLFILGLMAMFTIYLQPFFLVGGYYPNEGLVTVGLKIYFDAQSSNKAPAATLGLFLSLIGAPIILTIRHFLNKMFGEVNY